MAQEHKCYTVLYAFGDTCFLLKITRSSIFTVAERDFFCILLLFNDYSFHFLLCCNAKTKGSTTVSLGMHSYIALGLATCGAFH